MTLFERAYTNYQIQFRANALRVIVFVLFAGLLGSLILMVLGNPVGKGARQYHAVFTNASGLEKGSGVRAAGVKVGTVADMRLRPDHTVLVTFGVKPQVGMTSTTEARVRYANLTGDRYLELTAPQPSAGSSLPEGATIPASRTTPALDLDLVFNGFRPLTRALDPGAVNELTSSIISVSQGQGAALNDLLSHVASLTNTLGDRSVLIGQVIENLTAMLDIVNDHRDDVTHLIDGLAELMDGLADDRKRIGSSLESLSHTTVAGTDFLRTVRPPLKAAIAEAHRTAVVFNNNSQAADRYLPLLPAGVKALGRMGTYGSFFNFYLCGTRFKIDGPQGPTFTDFSLAKEYRCQFN
jgi:phospholipid/cholesterol/gamma-HCH transport system substrate-binding protein